MNLIYDQALSFGKLNALVGAFPDIINMGSVDGESVYYPGKEFTNADRLTVDVLCNVTTGGFSITVDVMGSAAESTANGSVWEKVGTGKFTLAQMKAGPCQVAISPNKFKYLRAIIASADGTFTGSAQAFLNTYAGK